MSLIALLVTASHHAAGAIVGSRCIWRACGSGVSDHSKPTTDDHFKTSHFKEAGLPWLPSGPGNIMALQGYAWPGNVRELLNVIERGVITSRSGAIRLDLPRSSSETPRPTDAKPTTPFPTVVSDAEMQQRACDNILAALDQTNWRVYGSGGAAELLGMRPTTLASRIKRLGLTQGE